MPVAGSANFDKNMPVIDIGSPGGGMSASENRMVNHKGRTIGSKSGPKATNDGKDLGKNAKNKIKGPAGLLTEEQSPSACHQSRNRYGGSS
jgi:hypothetical protein